MPPCHSNTRCMCMTLPYKKLWVKALVFPWQRAHICKFGGVMIITTTHESTVEVKAKPVASWIWLCINCNLWSMIFFIYKKSEIMKQRDHQIFEWEILGLAGAESDQIYDGWAFIAAQIDKIGCSWSSTTTQND